MAGRRQSSSGDLKDSILSVMGKYTNTPMSIQRLSLLISFEHKGMTTSWKTVKKHVDKLVVEKRLKTIKLPNIEKPEEGPITGYLLKG